MTITLNEKEGIKIANFTDLPRFTLAVCDEVKTKFKPILSQKGTRFIIDLKGIEFIDSSGIGCIISLFKTAQSNGSFIKFCNLAPEVDKVFALLRLPMILSIETNIDSCIKNYQEL